ncbi:acyltransferase family protein [Allosphingosinicella sp.]|uniref:acyltransferase family protein n=1 Tax=Allosphingosinicella sp. TaxID=2823234 RepID=UPI002FC1244D
MQDFTLASRGARLIYLDWIRVGAFGLLILFHVGMFYVTWDWHVKSDHVSHAIEPLMLASSPWRLTLLFLVSGVATRFMTDKLAPGALAGRRTARLLPPLLLGMLVIVPPQSYYEVVEKHAYSDGYFAFWSRYLAADQSFCQAGECLILPTWNHLWFVAYLLVYTLLAVLLLAAARERFLRLGDRLAGWLTGAKLIIYPILFLAAARIFLLPVFDVTHALVDDWYNHAVSFAAFLFGFLMLKHGSVAAECIRLRWPALALFLVSYGAYAAYYWIYAVDDVSAPEWLRNAVRVVHAIEQWSAIVAVLGFGARHLTRDSKLLRTLTEAVFPFYIAHQTIIVVAGHHLKALELPAPAEGAALVAITAAGCWLTYEVVRRIAPLRPLFGLAPRKPGPPVRHALDPVPAAD